MLPKVFSLRTFADPRVRCSVICFMAAVVVAATSFFYISLTIWHAALVFLILPSFLLPINGWKLWQYSLQSVILGLVFTYSLLIAYWIHDRKLSIFFSYMTCLSMFHYLEFFFTALTSLATLECSSFLLDHSLMYWVAAVGSWVEFFMEYFLFPQVKVIYVSFFGLFMVIIGEVFRKLAMVHAGSAFTHVVVRYRRVNHVLVTNGVYSLVRHPGYAGWFIWCIGTQVLLCNPICVVLYAITAWFFFKERIFYEERLLLQFFGDHYRVYQKNVPLGIPFIRGYSSET